MINFVRPFLVSNVSGEIWISRSLFKMNGFCDNILCPVCYLLGPSVCQSDKKNICERLRDFFNWFILDLSICFLNHLFRILIHYLSLLHGFCHPCLHSEEHLFLLINVFFSFGWHLMTTKQQIMKFLSKFQN